MRDPVDSVAGKLPDDLALAVCPLAAVPLGNITPKINSKKLVTALQRAIDISLKRRVHLRARFAHFNRLIAVGDLLAPLRADTD